MGVNVSLATLLAEPEPLPAGRRLSEGVTTCEELRAVVQEGVGSLFEVDGRHFHL